MNAILLRHGIRYPKETRWTKEHGLWLHRQRFDEPALQFTYEADVEQAELLAGQLKRIDKHVAATAAACRYTPVIEALMCLRGIQITTAFGLAVEIGDWTRFTGSSIGSYLGLVPSEDSSGQSRHQGPITKAGNTYARKLLIEAAWQHRRPYARPGERLLRQLDRVAPATRIRALEGNHRLHHKWELFDAARKCPSRPTPRSPANSPAGAGRWPPRSSKENAWTRPDLTTCPRDVVEVRWQHRELTRDNGPRPIHLAHGRGRLHL